MNRSTGAYAPLHFQTFCIVIRLAKGGCYQTTKTETSSKRALGQAFGDLRADGIEPAAEKAVAFCKTPDRMTEDERWQWDVQTDADERKWARQQRESACRWSDLDLY